MSVEITTKTMFTIRDIRERAEMGGSHFFAKDTMRFFRSRVLSHVFTAENGSLFVTSERGPGMARAFTVRFIDHSGKVSTVGEFNKMGRIAAIGAARRLAAKNFSPERSAQ